MVLPSFKYQTLQLHYPSLGRSPGSFNTLMPNQKFRDSKLSIPLPEFALIGSTMPTYEIACSLLSMDNDATISRAIIDWFHQLGLLIVVSASLIDLVP